MTYIDIVEEHAVWWNRMREIEEHHNPPHPASNELSILLDYDTIDNKYISREKKIYLPGDQHRWYVYHWLVLFLFIKDFFFLVVSAVHQPTSMMCIWWCGMWWKRSREIEEHYSPSHPASNAFSIVKLWYYASGNWHFGRCFKISPLNVDGLFLTLCRCPAVRIPTSSLQLLRWPW